MSDHEQTGPLWTEAVRAECARQSAECGEIPCWRIPPGDGPVDEPYGQIDPCAQCLLAVLANEAERLTAERDALAERVAALEAERDEQYYLLLKWGTFKGGCFNEAMEAIFEKYKAAGLSASAAEHQDTDEQHALLHDLIDACPGEINNDYCGTVYTKAEAHAYLDDWRTRKAATTNQETAE
jgi:hypothetical protein